VEVNKWLVGQGLADEADVVLRSFAKAGYGVEEWLPELRAMDPGELRELAAAARREAAGDSVVVNVESPPRFSSDVKRFGSSDDDDDEDEDDGQGPPAFAAAPTRVEPSVPPPYLPRAVMQPVTDETEV
jgi:hypothetical protein